MALIVKHLLRKTLRIFLWILSGVTVLLIILLILIQLPAVQDFAKQKALSYLQRRLGTPVRLRRLRIIFPNQVLLEGLYVQDRGRDTLLSVDSLRLELAMFHILHHKIDIGEIDLSGVRAKVYQSGGEFNYAYILKAFQSPPSSDTTAGTPYTYHIGAVHLHHMSATFRDSAIDTRLDLGDLLTHIGTIDPARNIYTVTDLRMDSTNAMYHDTARAVGRDARSALRPGGAAGFDYHHLHLSNLGFAGDHLSDSAGSFRGHVVGAAFREGSGLALDTLLGDLAYDGKQASASGLLLKTDRSVIRLDASTRLSQKIDSIYINSHFQRCNLSAADVLLFAPLNQLRGTYVYLDGRLNGYINNITIPGLEVRGLRNTTVNFKGTVRGLPDAGKARYDIVLNNLVTDSLDICALAPVTGVHLPRNIQASGRFRGTIRRFQGLLDASTSRGKLHVQGNMDGQRYQGSLRTDGLDAGYILGQSHNVGVVTLQATARGAGFAYPSLAMDADVRWLRGEIRGYHYTNLGLTLHYHDRRVVLHSTADDPSIKYVLDASGRVQGKYPSIHMVLQLDTIDATALHLVTDTLRASGLVRADFSSTNPDSLQGTLTLIHAHVGPKLATDSLSLVAAHPVDSQYIHIYSEPLVLDWKGKFALTRVPAVVDSLMRQKVPPASESWVLDARLTPTPLLPMLAGSDTISLHASLHRRELHLTVATPRLIYGTDTVQHLDVEASNPGNFHVGMATASISGFVFNRTDIFGSYSPDEVRATVTLKDTHNQDWYRIGAIAKKNTISLEPDSLLLNHTAWTVSKDNSIHYDSTGIVAHDVRISHGEQSLTLNNTDVAFENFRLSTLTTVASQDSLIADGTIDGTVHVENVMHHPVFTSDLTVKDLTLRSDTVGNLIVRVDNKVADTYHADASLKGKHTDVTITGTYNTGGNMDLRLSIDALDLAAAKPFTTGELDDITGELKGDLHLTGTPSKFVPAGNLYFTDAVITPHMTGEPLKLSEDKIEFDNTGFNFSKFTLKDSAGNPAVIDGNVFTTDFRNIRLDLNFQATNFRMVNAPPGSDRLFYGKLNTDAAVNLEGDIKAPKATGSIHINKKTDFVFILPQPDPEVASRMGVVRFVGEKLSEDSVLNTTSSVRGINISTNISTDSSANFTMVIDQRNGDALKIRGRSNLTFGMDESGKTSLTGAYEVDQGSYSLTLQLLKKTFLMQRGSTITWTGDPSTALINLTANYPINTAPIDLVQNEISGRSSTDIARFKQRLPFTVSLMMAGELLKPVITFNISLPQAYLIQWPDVDTKLQQIRSDPSELNKQVFALLLLGRFVGDNPLETAGPTSTAGQMAFQSASQILTAQLNQLAANLIKGVDVSFDLNNTQDYSTGQEVDQTDLGVTFSKGLFNNRVKVNVGSDFELGSTYANQNTSNIAGDLSVDYQLSRDGRYMLRAYRKNQYQVVVEGQVIETGVSFLLTMDYNKFKEIFSKSK